VLFEKLSYKLLEVADILDKIIVNFSDKKELSKKFSELEHSADEVAHQLIEKINKTFITSFDREDIYLPGAAVFAGLTYKVLSLLGL
jgi:uncharacterized protein Yka (UPF0111/DUF47 family)